MTNSKCKTTHKTRTKNCFNVVLLCMASTFCAYCIIGEYSPSAAHSKPKHSFYILYGKIKPHGCKKCTACHSLYETEYRFSQCIKASVGRGVASLWKRLLTVFSFIHTSIFRVRVTPPAAIREELSSTQ